MPARAEFAEAAHVAVRASRRYRGRWQLRGASATGDAPVAVLDGLRAATRGRPAPDEAAWIARIELLRSLLATSPRPLSLSDLGVGRAVGSARTVGSMTRSSKPPRWAYLLFRLVRSVRPACCLELGACVGISAAYQAAALELNGAGRLVTLEGAAELAARSARTLEELDLAARAEVRVGRFAETVGPALADLRPVDWAFIDGDHAEDATLDYADRILAAAGPEAVLVFDDINWSDGMRSAWGRVVADERYALTVDLRSVGLAVKSDSAVSRHNVRVLYY